MKVVSSDVYYHLLKLSPSIMKCNLFLHLNAICPNYKLNCLPNIIKANISLSINIMSSVLHFKLTCRSIFKKFTQPVPGGRDSFYIPYFIIIIILYQNMLFKHTKIEDVSSNYRRYYAISVNTKYEWVFCNISKLCTNSEFHSNWFHFKLFSSKLVV